MTKVMKYDAYTDSGIDWLGEYPTHWSIWKLKDLTFYQEGPGIMADDFVEDGVPLIRISGLKSSVVSLNGCNFLDPEKVKKRWSHFRLKLGELLVSASATTGIAARVDKDTVGAIPYTGLIRFKSRSKLYINFLQYFLTASIFTIQIDLQKSGTTIQHYGPTHLGRVVALLPPLSEQRVLTDYLDEKTAQIDHKIDLLNQKAEQYSRLKHSLINETVTQGLDKYVPMKDSGVEWIGKVPTHWKVKRVKDLFLESKKKSTTGKETLLSVSEYTGVTRRKDNIEDEGYLTNASTLVGYKLCSVGELVINIMLAWKSGLGVSSFDGLVSPSYAVYSPQKSICSSFFHYLFRSDKAISEFKRKSTGIIDSRLRLYSDRFYSIEVAMPDFNEQKAIADYLDTKTAHIDSIIEKINIQIDKLKELRKTLIDDVVTGKIKVYQEGESV